MDVRKWVERKAAIAIGESGTSSDVKLIADTYTPMITKLAEALRFYARDSSSEMRRIYAQDCGKVAKGALAELKKP